MKKEYIAPLTEKTEVELEQGFMVSIEGHEVGNTGDYTDIGWDNQGKSKNSAW